MASQTITDAGGQQITVRTSAGTVENAAAMATAPSGAPSRFNYPVGFLSYDITRLSPGQSVSITVTLQAGTSPTDYVKCNTGATSCAALPPGYVSISGNTITLTLTDGGPGDADGKADGVITDLGAPAAALPTPGYWLSYLKLDFSSSPERSQVFVVPSNDPSAAPAIVTDSAAAFSFASNGLVASNGFALTIPRFVSNDRGQVFAKIPYALAYATYGASGGDHFFVAPLDDLAHTPTGVQVSSFATTNPQICGSFSGATDANDPGTTFFIVRLAGPAAEGQSQQCGTPQDQVMLFHLTDSANTAPAQLPTANIAQFPLLSFANTGTGLLSGLVALDSSGKLNFYADTGFAHPKQLLAGVASYSIVQQTPGYAFVAVQANAANGGSSMSLYRIGGSGDISGDLYNFQSNNAMGGNCGICLTPYAVTSPDGASLFFADNSVTRGAPSPPGGVYIPGPIQSYQDFLLKVAADGSAPAQAIYSASGGPPPGKNTLGNYASPALILPSGFLGDRLVFTVQGGDGYPAALDTLPVEAGPGATPTTIQSLDDGVFSDVRIESDLILTSTIPYDPKTGNAGFGTAEILKADGTPVRKFAHSIFYGGTVSLSGSPVDPHSAPADSLLISNYNAVQPTGGYGGLDFGGGVLVRYYGTDFATAPTHIRLPNGQQFVLASQEFPGLGNYADPVGGASDDKEGSGYRESAAAVDLVTNTFVVVTGSNMPNESDLPLFY